MDRFILSCAMLAVCTSAACIIVFIVSQPRERELSNFSTSLVGRTKAQKHNAKLAAQALNGKVIPPRSTFSFNEAVGPWTRDRGYKRAPVSYGGEIVLAFGGGVCQTSSALYNAALLAGLEIIERHPHQWLPTYVSPGRDAAVAYGIADLKLRNPYDEPVRIEFRVNDEVLQCRLLSSFRYRAKCIIESEIKWHDPPTPTVIYERELKHGRVVRVSEGIQGCTVRTYRVLVLDGKSVKRELISVDEYKAMGGYVRVGIGE
ncbi:MAG: VanW family protein [Armatimonadota bacterium]|nr:VanW family protein [Armatimonadota bacterium]MCX7777454.1 VanW family protein [Armatimonadota bacterium]MDW8025538.1 VanW family protein [Armatimonadota bacterium]